MFTSLYNPSTAHQWLLVLNWHNTMAIIGVSYPMKMVLLVAQREMIIGITSKYTNLSIETSKTSDLMVVINGCVCMACCQDCMMMYIYCAKAKRRGMA